MAEHEEQAVVVEWANLMVRTGEYPELGLLFAIPNGAKLPYLKTVGRNGKEYRWSPEAKRLKDEGLRPGVPDMMLPVARKGFHGLFIENKFRDNKPSPEQEAFLNDLAAQGYLAVVCWSATEVIETITEYLSGL